MVQGSGADHRTRSGNWRSGLILFCLSALLCVGAAEVAARAFWRLFYGVPLRHPGRILYAYYPELNRVDAGQPTRGDEYYDILLLGGSTLHKDSGSVQRVLWEQLVYNGLRKVRIFNLAMPAHTSRDSWLKYAALGKARFDLVIVYDGLNEARANNVPPELFQEDYGHYSWYEIVNALAPYHGTASFALPYTLRYLVIRIHQTLMSDRYVPTDRPRPDWIHHGEDLRSAASFKHNLDAILSLALKRADRVVLMTFALHVPKDYSLEAFRAKRLDYVLHVSPIELWGKREHVLAAVASHNEIIRSLASAHPEVLFVDQATLMNGSSRYYNDPCHFTVAGSEQFVENLLHRLLINRKAGEPPPDRMEQHDREKHQSL